jgi:hypothetical protein
MKKYDYKNGDKRILSAGTKGLEIRLMKGFHNTSVRIGLGEKGFLKGAADKDYRKMLEKRKDVA